MTATGPAEVGKTRLCEEASERARAAGLRVLWGRCWSDGGAPALWPWQPLLAELCGPRGAELLSSDVETVDPERFSRFQAVSDQLARSVERTPTILVIDDLHAADPGALLLTRFIAKARLRLALVITQRHAITDLGDEALPVMLRPFDLDDTVECAVQAGLVTTGGTDSFEYNHDLVRQAALSRLTAAERVVTVFA